MINVPEESQLKYDFSNMIDAVKNIQHGLVGESEKLRAELNLFFTDFECRELMVTDNTDHELFGLYIKPFDYDWASTIFNHNDSELKKFTVYSLELDSKLLASLDSDEFVSILIRDINCINNTSIISSVLEAIDSICAYKHIVLKESDCSKSMGLFEFAIDQFIKNSTSVLCKSVYNTVTAPDDIISGYGLTDVYMNAIDKIASLDNPLVDQIESTALMLNWYLSLYTDIDKNNRYVSTVLRKCVNCTGSKFIRRSIVNALTEIETFNNRTLAKYHAMTEAAKVKGSLYSRVKYNGLKSLEDDLYEYTIRVKNIDTEEDAIRLMRLISSRMELLDDYIHTEEDLSDYDKERWMRLFDKYEKLREELSKKTIYKNKSYGLFVDYNALSQMYGNPTATN